MKIGLGDWITYAGLGGLALGYTAVGVMQSDSTTAAKMPDFFHSPLWNFFPIAALAVAVAVKVARRGKREKPTGAKLSLQFFADFAGPNVIRAENVLRWYRLYNTLSTLVVDATGAEPTVSERGMVVDNLFILLEYPIPIAQVLVKANVPLPRYEVKDVSDRHMIIVFGGQIPACMLDIETAAPIK